MADDKVKYKLNNKDFETYGAYVSQSHGLIDIPERKPVLQHDWPDEDGIQMDLDAEPKYKPREITLDMFFRASSWSALDTNIKGLLGELDNTGTQTLTVTPFEHSALTFEVIQRGKITIDKKFRKGIMYGILSLGLLEPEPKED